MRATLPLAGRTVLERQARLALLAGAESILLLVERMPAALTAAIDRLRRDRIPVQVARSAEEAAASVDINDRLLLIGDGMVAELAQLKRLSAIPAPSVMTVPDGSFGETHERIDARSRWAGLASFDASLLRETASMLRDWDLQSTLLRRALQAGAGQIDAEGPVAILDGPADIDNLERQIVARAGETGGGWASRLLAPAERAAVRSLMAGPITQDMAGTLAALLAAFAALAFVYDGYWVGLVLLLLATPVEGMAARLARMRMQDDFGRSWWCHLLPLLMGGAFLTLSYALARIHGWGMILLGAIGIAFLVAQRIEHQGREVPGRLWLADPRGMVWLMLPFACLGLWHWGLGFLFTYALGSFFWVQRQVHSQD